METQWEPVAIFPSYIATKFMIDVQNLSIMTGYGARQQSIMIEMDNGGIARVSRGVDRVS